MVPLRLRALPVLLLAACASAPPTPLPEAAAITAAEFPGAASLLTGFAPERQRSAWFPGETILYALRLERGSDVKRWLVRMTLLADKPDVPRDGVSKLTMHMDAGNEVTLMSPYLPFRVEVFDAAGAPQADSTVKVPYDFLRYSFLDAAGRLQEKPLTDAGRNQVAGAHAALISFLGILQNDPVLANILWQVVDRPGVLSVIASLGVTIGLHAELEQATPATAHVPEWTRSAVTFPLVLTINDTRALDAKITATDPWLPLRMGGGIVQVEATRPSDPSVRFTARVLAARAPEAAYDTAPLPTDARRP